MNLTKLSNSLLNYSDLNYNYAVNYQHMYNAPITLNFGEKHNRVKYIISAGNSDCIDIYQDDIFLYILSTNVGLNYINLEVINTELKEIESNVFFDSTEIDNNEDLTNIFDLSDSEQIKLLLNWRYC